MIKTEGNNRRGQINMRIQDILRMFGDYLRLGLVLVAFVLIVLLIGYLIIYKKICKGKRNIDLKQMF